MLTHECKGNASYKHLSIKQENIDLYYKNKPRIFATVPKYVYIDIWATWCGPCQREIPHLQKLEEKYHGKDIYFVSISCDNNKKAWENRVRAGLKGIQLHFVNGDTFMNDYMIKGIPRFILLDKEGKIISVDMSRPSDPKTIAKLDELLN